MGGSGAGFSCRRQGQFLLLHTTLPVVVVDFVGAVFSTSSFFFSLNIRSISNKIGNYYKIIIINIDTTFLVSEQDSTRGMGIENLFKIQIMIQKKKKKKKRTKFKKKKNLRNASRGQLRNILSFSLGFITETNNDVFSSSFSAKTTPLTKKMFFF